MTSENFEVSSNLNWREDPKIGREMLILVSDGMKVASLNIEYKVSLDLIGIAGFVPPIPRRKGFLYNGSLMLPLGILLLFEAWSPPN